MSDTNRVGELAVLEQRLQAATTEREREQLRGQIRMLVTSSAKPAAAETR